MDIRTLTETLVVLLTVIRCHFAEEIFKFAVVGSRIDLYCESGNEFGVDWNFKNQTGKHFIYRDKVIPKPFDARYSVTVSSNQTTVLSAEKVDSTYNGTYECVQGHPQHLTKSIRLVIITPTLCQSNNNLSGVGNTSHGLHCSFSIARHNSSDDGWPTELCANGEQWYCQILSNFNDDPLYLGCSASAKRFTEDALNGNSTSLRINASRQCASIYPKNTSTTTLSALYTTKSFSDGEQQIIIVICAVAGGFTLLTILSVALLTKTRNCRKKKSRITTERTNNIHRNNSDRRSEDHQEEAMYHTIEDSAAYAEIFNERCGPLPLSIYNDNDYILKPTNGPVSEGLYGDMQRDEPSIYSMCTA